MCLSGEFKESLGRRDVSAVLQLAALAPTTWELTEMHILGPHPDLLD